MREKFMFDSCAFDRLLEYLESENNIARNVPAQLANQNLENFITVKRLKEISDLPDVDIEQRICSLIEICEKRPYIECEFTDLFKNLEKQTEYYIIQEQIEELARTPDKKQEERVKLFRLLCSMRPILLTEPLALGVGRLGYVHVASEKERNVLEKIRTDKNHLHDAIIVAVANNKEITVVTGDKRFYNRLKDNNLLGMWYKDWLASYFN